MKLLAEFVHTQLLRCEEIIVAFSGGADSTAMLHFIASESKLKQKITAIHINHGIQPESNAWSKYCKEFCQKLDVKFQAHKLSLTKNSEDECRKARYKIFKNIVNSNSLLLTAHHSSDQFETVMMKLLRGTGISGLKGIEQLREFHKGHLLRPLLGVSKEQILEYLRFHEISWIEDPSNKDNQYTRNYLRNKVMPVVKKQWPQAMNSVNRLADNANRTQSLISSLMGLNASKKTLSINLLKSISEELRSTAIYYWLSSKNIKLPSQKALDSIASTFNTENPNSTPSFKTKNYSLIAWQGEIHCIKNIPKMDLDKSFQWNSESPFNFAGGFGVLTDISSFPKTYEIRFGLSSEKILLPNHKFRKKIRNLFQEYKVAPWLRGFIPGVYVDKELKYVGYDDLYNDFGVNFVTNFKNIEL